MHAVAAFFASIITFVGGFFAPTVASNSPVNVQTTQPAAAAAAQAEIAGNPFTDPAAASVVAAASAAALAPTPPPSQTIINQPIIERIAPQGTTSVSTQTLAAILADFEQSISSRIAAINPPKAVISEQVAAGGNSAGYYFVPASQRIDQITNTAINTPTITGGTISGASISGYLPLSGGTLSGALSGTNLTLTGDLTVSGAQTLSGAVTIPYVNATSTTADSTFVRLSATNATTTNFAISSIPWGLLSTDGLGHIVATSTPTAANFIATSATATSTFAGGFTIGGSQFVVQQGSGNVGIGTTSPFTMFAVAGTSWLATTTVSNLVMSGGPQVDVRAYGATGDCSTDDTSAIQAAINAAPAGSTVFFPPVVSCYKVTSALSVSKALTLLGRRSKITQTTANVHLLDITSSNVRVSGFIFQGPQSATYRASEDGIVISGTFSAGNPPTNISNITIENNEIDSWGAYGIQASYLTNFKIYNNRVTNIVYAGIAVFSGSYGTINGNYVDNITSGDAGSPSNNGYGVAVSRFTSDAGNLTSQPRSSDIVVSGNTVANVATWEGLDTHCGQRITFSNNTIRNAFFGPIAVGTCANSAGSHVYAPLDVTVSGNVVESSATDGSNWYGVIFQGVNGGGGERATGSITGNTVKNYGLESNSATAGALYIYGTDGLTIAGNSIVNPSPVGIQLNSDNYGFSVTGNTIVDPWSNTNGIPVTGIHVAYGNNTGTISGNTITRSGKSATYTIDNPSFYAIRMEGYATDVIQLGPNTSQAGNYLRDPLNLASTRLQRTSIGTSTPTSLFTVWGSGSGTGQLLELINSASTTLMRMLENGTAYFKGNIGIGTTSPQTLLHLYSNAGTNPSDTAFDLSESDTRLRIEHSSPSNGSEQMVTFGAQSGGSFTPSAGLVGKFWGTGFNSGRLGFITANTGTMNVRAVIDENGNFGIGTTSPLNIFHVQAADDAQMYLAKPGSNIFSLNFVDGSQSVIHARPVAYTHQFYTSGTTVAAATEKMRLSSAGGLSLGNSYVATNAGAGNMILSGTLGIGTTTPWGKLSITGSGTGTGLAFAVADSANTPRFSVLDNGKVGIGTTTPQANLHIVQGGVTDAILSIEQNVSGTNDPLLRFIIPAVANTWVMGTDNSDSDKFKIARNAIFDGTREYWTLDTAGNVGIGTTTPAALLTVAGSSAEVARFDSTNANGVYTSWTTGSPGNNLNGLIGSALPLAEAGFSVSDFAVRARNNLLFIANGGIGNRYMMWTNAGNLGIGTTTPTAQLSTTGTVRFAGLGSGGANLVTDSLGNVTVSSDERLKDKQGDFTRGLAAIDAISPVLYKWRPETGFDTQSTYAGFFAQNVQAAIPEAVSQDSRGYLTLADRPILAALVNATKEIGTIAGAFKSSLTAWLGSASNGIGDLFAKDIYATNGTFDTTSTRKLCITDGANDNAPLCVTKSQLAALLGQTGAASLPLSVIPQAPVIELHGNASSTIDIGDTYNDLGARITAPESDVNLGIIILLDGATTTTVSIDTTTPGEHTILYTVTSPTSGLTSSVMRTVVVSPADQQLSPEPANDNPFNAAPANDNASSTPAAASI